MEGSEESLDTLGRADVLVVVDRGWLERRVCEGYAGAVEDAELQEIIIHPRIRATQKELRRQRKSKWMVSNLPCELVVDTRAEESRLIDALLLAFFDGERRNGHLLEALQTNPFFRDTDNPSEKDDEELVTDLQDNIGPPREAVDRLVGDGNLRDEGSGGGKGWRVFWNRKYLSLSQKL